MAQDNKYPVEVHHEWGKLKEVIIGTGNDLAITGYHKSLAFAFINNPNSLEFVKEYGGKLAMEVKPEATKEMIAQIENLVKVLESRGIKVHRPAKLSPGEMNYLGDLQKGSMFIYARDPILIIDNNIIEISGRIPMRTKEKFAYRELLKKLARERVAKYFSIPAPSPDFDKKNIYLEGGDVLLNGYDIYVGNSSWGSNLAGIDWLQNQLGSKYRVHEVKISSEFIHLDCVMSLIRPGLMVICKETFVNGIPEQFKDWDYINVSVADSKKLGCNLMVLDEKTVIVDAQHKILIKALREKGIEVIEVPYDKVAKWGGGLRCSHHPIFRESKLPEK